MSLKPGICNICVYIIISMIVFSMTNNDNLKSVFIDGGKIYNLLYGEDINTNIKYFYKCYDIVSIMHYVFCPVILIIIIIYFFENWVFLVYLLSLMCTASLISHIIIFNNSVRYYNYNESDDIKKLNHMNDLILKKYTIEKDTEPIILTNQIFIFLNDDWTDNSKFIVNKKNLIVDKEIKKIKLFFINIGNKDKTINCFSTIDFVNEITKVIKPKSCVELVIYEYNISDYTQNKYGNLFNNAYIFFKFVDCDFDFNFLTKNNIKNFSMSLIKDACTRWIFFWILYFLTIIIHCCIKEEEKK